MKCSERIKFCIDNKKMVYTSFAFPANCPETCIFASFYAKIDFNFNLFVTKTDASLDGEY